MRGVDLIESTPRQIDMQRLLGLPAPHCVHLRVSLNVRNDKFSRQILALRFDVARRQRLPLRALQFRGQIPPEQLAETSREKFFCATVAHWRPEFVPGVVIGKPGDSAV
ncbi:MAG TPA: hypothetical protein VEI74_05280 [Candidatus Methylomirabilis sp.]|nr:hypothetical protein [Candidatus Methylomirabilis sp.]